MVSADTLKVKKYTLEVCVDSVESAIAAEKGGATRLELCQDLVIGGTTPSPSLFFHVKEAVDLPVNVLIRPRFSDFLYSKEEILLMADDIAFFSKNGANAVVTGALLADGSINKEAIKLFAEKSGKAGMTFHRAFDMCKDPLSFIKEAPSLGVDTILTSGLKQNAKDGAENIKTFVKEANGTLTVLAGGGINAGVIAYFLKECRELTAFHMSGKTEKESAMVYKNNEVNMGIPGINEYSYFVTDEKKIREASRLLF
ncbi:MAG: copper homeostasis protein CutC [Lachnospiraceae bacterium]|nr:copper homeostasis protein CutC [Lachnospiraceae bacterium]